MSFIHVMQSIITPVFSVTWSSEIILIYWFTAQETILIIINLENSSAALYIYGNLDRFFFQDSLNIEFSYEYKTHLNIKHLFEIKVFWSI